MKATRFCRIFRFSEIVRCAVASCISGLASYSEAACSHCSNSSARARIPRREHPLETTERFHLSDIRNPFFPYLHTSQNLFPT